MDLRQKVMYGLRWSAGMRFLAQLFTWAVTIFVIRILTPADYGLMGLATVFVGFLAMLSQVGLGSAIVQRRDLDESSLRAVFGFVLFASVAFCLLLFVIAPFVAQYYEEPQLVLMIQVLALSFLLTGLSVLPKSILLREMAYQKIAVTEFLSAISGSVVTLLCVLNGMGVWSLIAGYLMIRVVKMVSLYVAHPFFKLPRFRVKGMKSIITYSGSVTLSEILWYFYTSAVPTLIIGKILGKEVLGFYGVGLYLASLPMEKVSGLINQVAFPAFSSIQSDPHLAGQHFLKAVRVLSFIAFPIFLGISSIGPELIEIFLGAKWNQASLPLQLIAFVIPLRMVRNLIRPAAMGLGRADICLLNEITAFALMPLAFYIASYWGLIGVCLVWIVIFPVVFALNLMQAVKIFSISALDVVHAMQKPALSGVIMYICVQLIKQLEVENFLVVPRVTLFIICGVLVYGCMTLFFNKKGLSEIKGLVKV